MNNRIYKFRAWDKDKEKMVYDGDTKWKANTYPVSITNRGIAYCDELPRDLGNIVVDENGREGYRNWECDEVYLEVELIQYIGLKDSKNVEVYEGDILEYTDAFDVEQVGKVIYDNNYARFALKSIEGNIDGFMDLASDDFEVLGNVFENPELLGGKHE